MLLGPLAMCHPISGGVQVRLATERLLTLALGAKYLHRDETRHPSNVSATQRQRRDNVGQVTKGGMQKGQVLCYPP